MKRFVVGLVLAVMVVFSLSADEIVDLSSADYTNKFLKERNVSNLFEGYATVVLCESDSSLFIGGPIYDVEWWMDDGSDVVYVYRCDSLEQAFNVWYRSQDWVQRISQFDYESVFTPNYPPKGHSGLRLFKYYNIMPNYGK